MMTMKSIVLFLAAAIAFSGCTAQNNAAEVLPADFQKGLQQKNVQVLDVRTAAEFKSGHLAGALQADWLNPKEFADRIQHLDKSKTIYLYCGSGARSREAQAFLKTQGFTQTVNLRGGIQYWKIESLPVVGKSEVAPMPLPAFLAQIKSGTVLVDVGAAWCPPCVKMEPIVSALEKKSTQTFTRVNVDGGNDVAVMKHLKAEGLPTFIVFKDGKETWRHQGICTEEALLAALR
jgi:rhodanese-related sulfurtransferase